VPDYMSVLSHSRTVVKTPTNPTILPPISKNVGEVLPFILLVIAKQLEYEQEAQLPQRNSVSAAHMEGGWG